MAKKSSRKSSRKVSRRKGRRGSRRHSGGGHNANPANVDDTSMTHSKNLNLAQGGDYESLHVGQHGGAAVSLASSAPPGYTGMLDDSLRTFARVGVIDQSIGQIQGMSDQSGGRRKKMSSKRLMNFMRKMGKLGRRASRRVSRGMRFVSRKIRRGVRKVSRRLKRAGKKAYRRAKKVSRRIVRAGKKLYRGIKRRFSRRMSGGMAPYDSPGMLLDARTEEAAVNGMNPEWKLATDPGAFNPKMGV